MIRPVIIYEEGVKYYLRKRSLISLRLMVPILLLSPMIQMFMGTDLRFSGDSLHSPFFIFDTFLLWWKTDQLALGAVLMSVSTTVVAINAKLLKTGNRSESGVKE